LKIERYFTAEFAEVAERNGVEKGFDLLLFKKSSAFSASSAVKDNA